MIRFFIQKLKWLIKWSLIVFVAVSALGIVLSIVLPFFMTEEQLKEYREEEEERKEERQKAEEEREKALELEILSERQANARHTLEDKINIVSSYEDVLFLSCPAMRVTKASACGRARELTALRREHCGEGYRTNQDLGDYFVVLGKSSSDQDYQRYFSVLVRPGSGDIVPYGGFPRDVTSISSGTSAYGLEGVGELDRRSLELSERSYVTRYALHQKYGIVDDFYVTYSFEAQTKCSPIGDGSSITDLINDASLRRQEAEEQRLQLEQEKKERLIREQQERDQSLRSKNKI